MDTDGNDARIDRLQTIVRALRHPQTGCPWDLRQDHASMRAHLVEEAYEVLDAIDDRDDLALREELGDLAFQIVFHAQLADERGAFNLQSVLDTVADKMIDRHPHVFAHAQVDGASHVLHLWERRKQEQGRAVLAGIPRHLPALQRAQRITARASTVGFDGPDLDGVMNKVDEEIAELKQAVDNRDNDAIEDELGDTLFALVNLARKLDVDAEAALRRTLDKFQRRFAHIEAALALRGRHPADATLDEMDRLWDDAKALERKPADNPDA